MSEIARIREEIRQAYAGQPWHGPSVGELVTGVDATSAAARPVPGAHTIWELVLHLTAWAHEVTRRLQGGKPGLPPEGDWPPVPQPTGEAWDAALVALRNAHQELLATVERFPEERLIELVAGTPPGTGVTYYHMLHGLVQHDAYHGGQIALLRKALAAATQSRD